MFHGRGKQVDYKGGFYDGQWKKDEKHGQVCPLGGVDCFFSFLFLLCVNVHRVH